MNLELLPEDCFAQILSRASAREACQLSIVSKAVRLMADSDAVWEKFLQLDYDELLQLRFVSPVTDCSTKKELFIRLCSPHLIDDGKKMFYIDKVTGKKCFILSARELLIEWSHNALYWSWNIQPFLNSRFREVAELRTTWWLEIKGKINAKLLSPNTTYLANLLVKFADRAYGLDTHPSQVSVQFNQWRSECNVILKKDTTQRRSKNGRGDFTKRVTDISRDNDNDNVDGDENEELNPWVEIELGKFYVDDLGDVEVEFCLKEVQSHHLRGGLVVDGIEIKPLMEAQD